MKIWDTNGYNGTVNGKYWFIEERILFILTEDNDQKSMTEFIIIVFELFSFKDIS